MQNIIEILKHIINGGLVPIIDKIVNLLSKLSSFGEKIYDNHIENEKKEEIKKADDEIKNACDNGTLDDLIDAVDKKDKI